MGWQDILKKDKKDMKTGKVYSSDRKGKKIMMLTLEPKSLKTPNRKQGFQVAKTSKKG